MNQFTYHAPDLTHLMSQLRIKILPKYRRIAQPDGPEGRLRMMRESVTAVIKYERIELNYGRADEARGYVERLISDAIRYGDTDQRMMDMADFWLKEKQLIHKLFKVLVPRFVDFPTAYTNLYKAPLKYPELYKARSVLELKGNPFPPLVFSGARNKNMIHNVLLDEARKEFGREKHARIAEQVTQLEKEQKQQVHDNGKQTKDSEKSDANVSKAAQDVSESEQLLKSVSTEMDESGAEKPKPKNDGNNDEFNPVLVQI